MSNKDIDYCQGIGINDPDNLLFINSTFDASKTIQTYVEGDKPQQNVSSKNKIPCKCGGVILHFRTNHKCCLWKKGKDKIKTPEMKINQ